MSHGMHPRIQEALTERYIRQAERWAQECVRAGLTESDLRVSQVFAASALRPTAIVDWFKRRSARNRKWRAVVTPAIIDELMEVRSWAQTQEPNIQKQAQIVCAYVDLMANAARFYISAAKVK